MRVKAVCAVLMATVISLSGCGKDGFTAGEALLVGAGVLQAAMLDEGQVKQLSARAAAKMDEENKVAPPGSAYAERLQRITRSVDQPGGIDFNFKVYMSDQLNAFAMADGTVRVYSGLMEAMPDDELRAVILHEIGHVVLDHSYDQMKKQLYTNAAFQALVSAGGTIGDLTQSQLGNIAYTAINAKFSQEDELEADRYAVKSLHRMGRDPYAMKRAIKTLQEKAGGGGGFLSSHPSNQTRIDKIEGTIQRL